VQVEQLQGLLQGADEDDEEGEEDDE